MVSGTMKVWMVASSDLQGRACLEKNSPEFFEWRALVMLVETAR
jgi:hypothetical protein